jgi:hypothetical protein
MSRLWAALALLPVALGTRLLHLPPGTQAVNVVLQVNRITSEAAVDVWSEDKSDVLAHSCSGSVASGSFESTPLVFAVNEYGAGNLKVGAQTYTIHDKPEISGGIICGRITSPGEIIVSCDVPVSASLQLKSLSKRDLQDCFPRGPVELSEIIRGLETGSTNDTARSDNPPSPAAAGPPNAAMGAAYKRQGSCGPWIGRTLLKGNGNPHQNPLNIQISVRLTLVDPQPPDHHFVYTRRD